MPKAWLNYHHLHYFMTIALEGGIGRASSKLRLGQSTLSTQLAQFEHQLGVVLFERRLKRLHLTESGRVALRYAQQIFKLGDELLDSLRDRRDGQRVAVQIGIADAIPKFVVAEVVLAAQSAQPCTIALIEGSTETLLSSLKAHDIDIALTSHEPAPDNAGSDLRSRPLARLPVTVVGAQRFRDLAAGFPASLENQPFLMPDASSGLRQTLRRHFDTLGIAIDIILESQDTAVLSLLAARGLGVLPLSEARTPTELADLGLFVLGSLKDVDDEIWLVRGRREFDNPVAAWLFRELHLTQGVSGAK